MLQPSRGGDSSWRGRQPPWAGARLATDARADGVPPRTLAGPDPARRAAAADARAAAGGPVDERGRAAAGPARSGARHTGNADSDPAGDARDRRARGCLG